MNKNNRTFRKQHYSSLFLFFFYLYWVEGRGSDSLRLWHKRHFGSTFRKKTPILSSLRNRLLTPALPETHQQKHKTTFPVKLIFITYMTSSSPFCRRCSSSKNLLFLIIHLIIQMFLNIELGDIHHVVLRPTCNERVRHPLSCINARYGKGAKKYEVWTPYKTGNKVSLSPVPPHPL